MNRYNLWKWDSSVTGATGGWVYVGVVRGVSENHALTAASITMKIKKSFLRVYPHVDGMPAVRS